MKTLTAFRIQRMTQGEPPCDSCGGDKRCTRVILSSKGVQIVADLCPDCECKSLKDLFAELALQ